MLEQIASLFAVAGESIRQLWAARLDDGGVWGDEMPELEVGARARHKILLAYKELYTLQ